MILVFIDSLQIHKFLIAVHKIKLVALERQADESEQGVEHLLRFALDLQHFVLIIADKPDH
jgi:hypothetical protein